MPSQTSKSPAILIGLAAPDFALPASGEEYHSLYDFRGRKLILVFLRHLA